MSETIMVPTDSADQTAPKHSNETFFSWLRGNRTAVKRVLAMALFSRFMLVLAGWIANYFQKNPVYQTYIDRGYQFTPHWLIDMWARWDAGWYLSIAGGGYSPGADLGNAYSNMAFFPLYPYLVKAMTFWLPGSVQSAGVLIFAGLILSNLCFLMGMLMLYYLTRRLLGEEKGAERAVLLTLCLPAAFIFSAFYTESLYLLLTLAVCIAAEDDRWLLSAIFASLAALTRANGFVIAVVPAWIYLSRCGWDFRRMGWRWIWFMLVPLAVVMHFAVLYRITGNFFAFFQAQKAWSRGQVTPLQIVIEFLAALNDELPQVGILDRIAYVSYAFAAVWAFIKAKNLRAYMAYAAALVAIYGASGLMYSQTRYTLVVFPVAIFLASRFRDEEKFYLTCAVLAMIQVLLWIGWTNYYWIC